MSGLYRSYGTVAKRIAYTIYGVQNLEQDLFICRHL